MKVLHIDSSVRGDWSVSKDLTKHFVQQLLGKFPQAWIDYLDLAAEVPPHPSPIFIRANYTPAEDRTREMEEALMISNSLVNRMRSAEIIVIGIPMHNFSIPSILKAYIDNIVRINETFAMTENGSQGLLTGKKVFIISTRGADFNNEQMQPMDQIKPYIKVVFGFMGMEDITYIDASPVQFADLQARAAAIQNAKEKITATIGSLTSIKR